MSDFITDAIQEYAEEHSSPEPRTLTDLNRRAHLRLVNPRMSSGHLQGRLLKMLTQMIRPRRALEIGTFAGYSALSIAEGMDNGATLLTVEHNDELETLIRENLASSPYGSRVELRIGDAMELMAGMEDCEFDMVFIDADKRRYSDYYREAMRLTAPGGYILADNTLWDGHVADPAYDRDRQTRAIRAFNDLVAADPAVEKVVLPLRDGLTLIRKL